MKVHSEFKPKEAVPSRGPAGAERRHQRLALAFMMLASVAVLSWVGVLVWIVVYLLAPR
jgi:hypothetical protein